MQKGFECNFSKLIFTFPEIQWVVFYWQCDRNRVSGESQIRIGFQRNIRPQLLKSFQTQPNHEVEIKSSEKLLNLRSENQNSDQIPAKIIQMHLSQFMVTKIFSAHIQRRPSKKNSADTL